jgi:hypothetical protein
MVWKLPSPSSTFDVDIKGKVYHLPKLGDITLDQIGVIGDLDIAEDTITIDAMKTLFDTIAPDLPVGSMTGTQLRALITAWQKESGIGLGESVASARSSKSTGKR